jgi:MinD-like ATPase involved in chromosome partitioning or flagellar assembly
MLVTILKPLEQQYEYILIDCLPSLGLLAINALRAANGIVIPVQADFLAMQGLAQIFETIAAVREQLNPDLNILGVLLTLVDQRTAHSRDVVKVVRSSLDGQVNVFGAEIRLHVALKETAKLGRSIFEYDGASRSAVAYRQLGLEVLAACGDEPSVPVALDIDALEAVVSETPAPADLRDLPLLTLEEPVAVREAEEILVAPRPARFDAPAFSSFLGDGWQRWLGEY